MQSYEYLVKSKYDMTVNLRIDVVFVCEGDTSYML